MQNIFEEFGKKVSGTDKKEKEEGFSGIKKKSEKEVKKMEESIKQLIADLKQITDKINF